MRIEIFQSSKIDDLENKVNEYLEKIQGKVIDIKYSGNGNGNSDGETKYSVMIIFE